MKATNGVDIFGMMEDKRGKIEAVEMNCLSSMCRVTMLDKERNEDLTCRIGLRKRGE